ncbi:MAG: hypothetical protein GTN82_17800 [Candidatus Aminicenantes bacterium]|nr:hypothetical protein [Candidatus Aminicenantes bacterium]
MRKTILTVIVLLFTASSILAAKVIPMDLYKPFRIRTDGERIFIGQGAEIFIYSANDFKLLKKFGKAGEGPQEFKLRPEFSPEIDVHTDTLVATSIGKVSFFTKDGKFLHEKKVTGIGLNQFYRKLGDKLVGERFLSEKANLYRAVSIYDSNLNKIKEIFQYKYYIQRGKQYNPIERGLYIANFYIHDHKIFIGGEIDSGTIHVFNTDGNHLYNIQPKLEKVKFTEADKKGYIDSYLSNSEYARQYERIKNRFKYPDYFPLFQDFIAADKRIYIQTYKRDETDTKNEFYILTLKGELIKRVWLPLEEFWDFTPNPYAICNGKLYQVVDNQEEDMWELHISEVFKQVP